MKIAVNLLLASPTSVTGAFVYIEDILPELFRLNPASTYYLVGSAETIAYFKRRYTSFPGVRYRVCDIRRDVYTHPLRAFCKWVAKVRGDASLRERIVAREIQSFCDAKQIDVYFSPSSVIYPRNLRGVRQVTTILDVQPEYFPENFPKEYLEERRRDAAYAIAHSTHLIAISAYTKQTLVEKYAADPEKIAVIHLAPHESGQQEGTLPLPQEFVFYPAALWPHKNHRVLIEALALLKERFPTLHVVCTGVVKRKDLKKELDGLVASRGLAGRVHFMGYVADTDMRHIYTKAKALVFPSAFEGFGIPLVEAMQFGVPVIAADNSSITEVVSGAGLLVPTGDAPALAAAIERVLTGTALRDDLVAKGSERAKLFSWEKAARETLAVFAQ